MNTLVKNARSKRLMQKWTFIGLTTKIAPLNVRIKKKGRKTVPNELKPCPFCGGTNIRIDGYWCIYFDGFYVRCLDCEASSTPKGTKRSAKNAWNRRAYEETK